MNIRTILSLLSMFGAISTAAVVWFLLSEKEAVRVASDAELQRTTYSDAWNRFIDEQSTTVESFGLEGIRGAFWRPENPLPLNFARSVNASNYFTDFSASATGEIENPVVKAIQAGDLSSARRFLTIFFGAPLQTREILFYSIIDANSLERFYCQKSLFSRDYDPCSSIYETYFIDKGSRFELYGSLNSTREPWTGYMVHSNPAIELFSLVHAFPVTVGSDNEFIVVVGQSLDNSVQRLSDELNVNARLFNVNRTDSLYTENDNVIEIYIKSSLSSILENNSSLSNTVITNNTDRMYCRALYFFQGDGQSDFCATASRASAASLIPLNQIDNSQYDFRLAVTRDVSDILFETDGITINVFMISVIAVLAILIIVFFVQQTIYRRLTSAIHVLNELTHGNLDTDFKHKKSFFVNEDDEVGKLVSALKIYKTSLQELDDERKNRRLSRLERDKLIIEKMRTLSLQLEGDAQALLVRDIDQMQTMMDQVAGKHFQSGNSTDRQKTEEDSNRLISVAFERMSDQVTALIEARTAEMESARDEANEANTAKSKFLANMSHELRTPLNAIIGYGELLLEEAEEEGIESMSEDLKRITDSGTHLLNLINDILDISKIEAGRLELFISDFELANVINTLESVAKPLGEKNNNQVIFERAQTLGSMHTDETRLRQSLLNLIGNACKFTENGEVKLTITNSTNDNNVLFAVSDTGIGLTDEQMAKIFDDFTQAGSETTAKFGGTGLGLSITKNLIEMMGGTLSVKSKIGTGSVFTIEVPRNCETALPSAAISNNNTEISGLIQEGSGPRILIIDDDSMTHDIIKRKLSDEDFSIFSALDGMSGINAARKFAPDVIFLDILMPGKDGWAVIAELKADELLSKIPVIVISMLDDDFSAKALGANAYMKKPIEKEVLLENIANIFSGETAGKKALIIDDHADAREIISRILSATGFEIETAVNGADGLEKLASGFDLVILDLSMPVMDGFQFLARIEEANLMSPPQIIVYSAMHLDETMRASLSGQCEGIIDKNEIDAQASLETIVKQALSS